MRRGASLAATVTSALSIVIFVTLAVALLLGYRMLVVRSDSMAPAIRTGDVIITRVTRAGAIGAGDIVTFPDPSRAHKLVTHRVVERETTPEALHYVTRGDANGADEHWSVPTGGSLGEYRGRVPRIGYAIGRFGTPWARVVALVLFASAAGAVAVRRIWAL